MSPLTLVDPQEVRRDLGSDDLLIVDCRFDLGDPAAGRRAWAAGHVPGAHYADLDRDLASPVRPDTGRHPLPDANAFVRFAGALGVRPGKRVVCYDQGSGAIAVRLWWLLRYFGHAETAVMDGGFAAWQGASFPTDTRAPVATAASFHPHRVYAGEAHVDTLQRELEAGACLLLDARSAERFRGEVEPIDARAGHVPGARNRPFTENLEAGGVFKTPGQLREEFTSLLGDRDPTRVIHMCGSGVTACHNLLAMEHAGLRGSRLYVGSWSEWIRDPGRPIAQGPSPLVQESGLPHS